MTILQTFQCDIRGCTATHIEAVPGDGAPGWGEVRGISLNGKENPLLCPKHLKVVAEFLDAETTK